MRLIFRMKVGAWHGHTTGPFVHSAAQSIPEYIYIYIYIYQSIVHQATDKHPAHPGLCLGDKQVKFPKTHGALGRYPDRHVGKARRTLHLLVPALANRDVASWCAPAAGPWRHTTRPVAWKGTSVRLRAYT